MDSSSSHAAWLWQKQPTVATSLFQPFQNLPLPLEQSSAVVMSLSQLYSLVHLLLLPHQFRGSSHLLYVSFIFQYLNSQCLYFTLLWFLIALTVPWLITPVKVPSTSKSCCILSLQRITHLALHECFEEYLQWMSLHFYQTLNAYPLNTSVEGVTGFWGQGMNGRGYFTTLR